MSLSYDQLLMRATPHKSPRSNGVRGLGPRPEAAIPWWRWRRQRQPRRALTARPWAHSTEGIIRQRQPMASPGSGTYPSLPYEASQHAAPTMAPRWPTPPEAAQGSSLFGTHPAIPWLASSQHKKTKSGQPAHSAQPPGLLVGLGEATSRKPRQTDTDRSSDLQHEISSTA